MSGQDKPTTAQQRPDHTSDHNVEAAVEGTFPASDPVATSASQGARAVPPEEMMRGPDAKPQGNTASLTARFDSMETARTRGGGAGARRPGRPPLRGGGAGRPGGDSAHHRAGGGRAAARGDVAPAARPGRLNRRASDRPPSFGAYPGGLALVAAPGPCTPLVVEYSKCSASPGNTRGWIACAAIAASEKPCRISLSLPG